MDEYPVVVLRMNNMEPTIQEVDEFFDALTEELDKREGPYVTKVFGQSNFVSSEIRVHAGKRSNDMIEQFRGRAKGTAIINKSPIGRMMLKGVFLLVKQPLPMRVVSDEAEADKVIDEMLAVSA